MSSTTKRRVLGRGLSALIPVEQEQPAGSSGGSEQVDIASISPNPFQPRTEFKQEEIDGLAQSIQAQGLLQPIVVRKKSSGVYEIVSGERRFRACRKLGWDQVPCIVKTQVSDREMLEMALVENIQRENLNEIEQGNAYQRLLLDCNLSHEKLSERVGKSRSAITNSLRLLKLPAAVQQLLKDGQLSPGHARALLSIEDPARLRAMAERICSEGLTVRQAEEETRAIKGDIKPQPRKARTSKGPGAAALDADTSRFIEDLQYRFGTAVRLAGSSARGRIEISYSSQDDLNRILNLLAPAVS